MIYLNSLEYICTEHIQFHFFSGCFYDSTLGAVEEE